MVDTVIIMDLFQIISEPRQLTLLSVILRAVLSVLLGGIIGLERGLRNRPAGLRTYMLVCLGAALVMITNQYIYQVYGTGDPVRMGAQVISGIGFLGAGTIMVTPHSQIKGLTTAAGLWASACVGLAVGIGFIEAAVIGAAAIFTILTAIHILNNAMHKHSKVTEVYVELDSSVTIGDFIEYARRNNIEISDIQMEHRNSALIKTTSFVAMLSTARRGKHDVLLHTMQSMEGVSYIQEL